MEEKDGVHAETNTAKPLAKVKRLMLSLPQQNLSYVR